MRISLRTTVATAALLTLVLSGCGASGGGSDAAATTTSAKAGPTTTGVGSTTTADRPTTTAADETTSTEAPTTTAGGGDLCSSLKIINTYEGQSRGAVSAPWSEMQPILVDGTPPVLAAYDDAIAVAQPELAADLKTLRDFTAPSADLAKESSSLEDFGLKLSALPNLVESGKAGQRLDAYSRANCGFGTSEAGGPIGG